jgi:hypothetical protein
MTALLLLAAILAFVGIGAPQASRNPPNNVRIAGRVAADGHAIPIDLSKGFKVAARPLSARASEATRTRVTFSILGIDLASSTETLRGSGRGGRAAFPPSTDKFFVVGKTIGGLEFLSGDRVAAAYTFSADSTDAEYFRLITVPGAAAAVLLLFVIAYSESLLGSMRRGRRHLSGIAGMAVIGALLGVDLVATAWVLGVGEPTLATIFACALLSSGAGIAAALAAGLVGRRRRLLRLKQRDSLAAGA